MKTVQKWIAATAVGLLAMASAHAADRPVMMLDVVLPEVEPAAESSQGGGGGRGGSSIDPRVMLVTPVADANPVSILMIPGGGLSAQQYLATPDGRDGWAIQFARAGYPVYLINAPRADLTAEPREGGYEPESVWALWGFGPEFGTPYADSKHPIAQIDNLAALLRFGGPAPGQDVVNALIEQIGDVVVLGHSAGGRPTFGLASSQPERVRGVIVVEPVPCPTDADVLKADFVDLNRPMLSVWGDNLDRGRPSMIDRHASCVEAADVIVSLGGNARTLDLPAAGITGNSHLLMQDINSNEIGQMVLDWIADEVTPRQ